MIDFIIVWSEVWALLLPLLFFLLSRKKLSKQLKPILNYTVIALFLNLIANLISSQKKLGLNLPWHNNILLYNIHSIVRLILFVWFFWMLEPDFIRKSKFRSVVFSLLFIVIALALFESIAGKSISNYSYSVSVSLLLFFCVKYYFFYLKKEHVSFVTLPSFWIVTGLGLFVAITFPIFLFYRVALLQSPDMAVMMWRWQNLAFVLLNVFLSIGIYVSLKQNAF